MCVRGMVMALKPVWVEQVRWPERSHVPRRGGVGSVSLKFAFRLTLSEKNRPSDIKETGPGWAKEKRPESRHRRPRASPLYSFFLFLFVFWPYLSNLFSIFWPKWPSTRARTVVPLTMPLMCVIDIHPPVTLVVIGNWSAIDGTFGALPLSLAFHCSVWVSVWYQSHIVT